jgi:hypothetical protein
MKAIVHIGTIKTATSSIQEYLFQNQKMLIMNGYYFIQSSGPKNNRAIPSFCLKDSSDDNFFKLIGANSQSKRNEFKINFIKKFSEEINSIPDNIHTVIISSEQFHFATNSLEEVNNVKMFLSNYFDEIQIICYLREQLELCNSHYSSEIMMAGLTKAYEDFIEECNPSNIHYNYYDMLMNWERCFGKHNLKVSIFDSENLYNNNIIDDFFYKLNPKLVDLLDDTSLRFNQSINYSGQIIAKAVNQTFPKFEGDKVAKSNSIRMLCLDIIKKGLSGKGQQPSLEVANKIYSSFKKSNELVRRKYFPELSKLFKIQSKNSESFDFCDETISQVLKDLFTTISQNSNK